MTTKIDSKFKNSDRVQLLVRTEVSPLVFINSGEQGEVIDSTFPNYYLVRFDNHGVYWVDGCKLIFTTIGIH